MPKRFSWIVIGVALGACASAAHMPAARGATLRKIDDSTVNGDLVSVAEGRLTIAVKPATQATSQATTAPSTTRQATASHSATSQSTAGQSTTGPATNVSIAPPATTQSTRSLAMPLTDVVQVVFRTPPPKAPPKPPADAQAVASDEPEPQSPGVVASMVRAFFGSGKAARRSETVRHVGEEAATQPAAPTIGPATGPATGPAIASSQPSIHWQIELGGDVLHGRIDTWATQRVTFRLDSDSTPVIDLPADQLTAIWCGAADDRAQALALSVDDAPEDVAFVKKDADVVAVKGLALGIAGDVLRFKHDDQERQIALGKLVGVVFGSAGRKPPAHRFHQTVKLDTGDVISGTWTGCTADTISLQTAWGALVRLHQKDIYSIDFVDGRVVYLSDLKPDKVQQTPYFGRVIPWRADQSLDGASLRLSDGEYAKGIAVHSRCMLDYDIHASYQRFQAHVGFQQPEGKLGHAPIRVLGDGKILWESADARGDAPAVDVDLDVSRIQRLTLEVDFGRHTDAGGRIVWANARLLRSDIPR